MKIVSVIGNPKQQSKTSKVTNEIANMIGEQLDLNVEQIEYDELELAEIGPYLFEWGNAAVEKRVAAVTEADIVVVASPTYKATYTGLLKAFLDQLPQGGLTGKIAIPVMVGAAPQHYMAPDVYLIPLLLELGASCPLKGLYIMESQIEDLESIVSKWLGGARELPRLVK